MMMVNYSGTQCLVLLQSPSGQSNKPGSPGGGEDDDMVNYSTTHWRVHCTVPQGNLTDQGHQEEVTSLCTSGHTSSSNTLSESASDMM